jgi:hypothetical protein
VNAALPDGAGTSGNVYLTGHSQGGGRASLASMWIKKSWNKEYQTYVFSAVGTQCAVRYALPDVYASDVDVTAVHSHITNYVHVLDAYGRMDYGNGEVCLFGQTDLRDTTKFSPTKHFCERSVGYSGPTLLLPFSEKENDFAMCRYYTHWSSAVNKWLSDDTVLLADGTTDGGCTDAQLVPANDPEALCPPCRTPHCAVKLPQVALNWHPKTTGSAVAQSTAAALSQDVSSGQSSSHPCVKPGSRSLPKPFTSVDLANENFSPAERTFLSQREVQQLLHSGQ